jgi:predicted DNA-binding transcriptional regulator YafY
MVDRLERLTNLLALLLETAEPLSLVQISSELLGQYPDQEQARRAAFERDKAALREIGVPIETDMVTGGAYAGQTRYRIDRRAYELADLELDTDEMHALQVAVAAVRTDSTNAQDAIWKLGGMLGDGELHVSASLPERPELPAIRTAVAARASIEFSYRGEVRKLDPWGLLLRGGFWYVIGHDHLRGERRTFRIDRFDGGAAGIVVGESHTFERPESFDPRSAFPADPKQIGHAPDDGVEALVEVDGVRSSAVERELGSERVVERRPGGAISILVPASNLDAFRSWLFGLLDHAVVLEPSEVRTHIIEWLSDVARERTT